MRRLAVLVCLVVGTTLMSGVPADAGVGGTRAVEPFSLEGTPVKGSKDQTLPTPITQGVWTDTLPTGAQKLHYSYDRTIPGSTVWVTAITPGVAGEDESIQIVLSDSSRAYCAGGDERRLAGSSELISTQAVSHDASTDPKSGCIADTTLNVQVGRGIEDGAGPAPVQILVAEEPPVSDATDLPSAADDPAPSQAPIPGAARDIVGGHSFPDAPVIEAGKYSGKAVPGEASVFKVHLDWGQQLAVRYEFHSSSGEEFDPASAIGPDAKVRILDPTRASVSDSVYKVSNMGPVSGIPLPTIADFTMPVRYNNRTTQHIRSALAGDYYLQLSIDEDQGGTSEIPYTMSVAVDGDSQGAPRYAENEGWSVSDSLTANGWGEESPASATSPQSTDTPASAEAAAGTSSAAEASGPSRLLLGGGLAVVAMLCLGAAVTLFRRGRSS